MDEIAKISNLQPVSFNQHSEIKVTDAQKSLIAFLKEKTETLEIISRDDIVDFYILKVKGNEYYKTYETKWDHVRNYRTYDYDKPLFKKWKDDWNIKQQAIQWFKNNLGSCILKGKLLAIPVINI